MSLIQYIFKALRPYVYCEDNTLGRLLAVSDVFGDTGISFSSKRFFGSNAILYDVIIMDSFNKELFNDNLNYDGFYFMLDDGNTITLKDYEYFNYAGFYIVKKVSENVNSEPISLPYWHSHSTYKKQNTTPIILRNFDGKFNVIPYVQPYEIINHPFIIKNLCKEFKVKNYLELGVRGCPVPNAIKDDVEFITGVDTSPVLNFPGTFYKATTDEYFNMCRNGTIPEPTFDMIFIDACHNYEYVKRDFINSLRYVKVGGIVILHDTYPPVEYMTDDKLCSDAYRIVDYIRKMGLQLLNIPVSPGLCIIRVL